MTSHNPDRLVSAVDAVRNGLAASLRRPRGNLRPRSVAQIILPPGSGRGVTVLDLEPHLGSACPVGAVSRLVDDDIALGPKGAKSGSARFHLSWKISVKKSRTNMRA